MVGVGVLGAAALAIPFWNFRRKHDPKKDDSPSAEKPVYWVD